MHYLKLDILLQNIFLSLICIIIFSLEHFLKHFQANTRVPKKNSVQDFLTKFSTSHNAST